MPRRVAAVDQVAERLGRSILDMDLRDIKRARAVRVPGVPPFTWITGPVAAGVEIEDLPVPVRGGRQCTVRVYRPMRAPEPWPVLVFIHGGGWVVGDVHNYDPFCSYLAHQVGALLVSVDYRLAPEHHAPAGLEDCLDVSAWVAGHAGELAPGRRLAPWRLGICGDSAGGNLAAVVAQTARDDGFPVFSHQALVYPSLDATCLTASKIEHTDGPIVTRREMDRYFILYVGRGRDALTADDVRVSPLWGRLEGLPPTYVQTAGWCPLRTEGLMYVERLREAGVEVELTDYPQASHAFANFPGAIQNGWAQRRDLATQIARHLRR